MRLNLSSLMILFLLALQSCRDGVKIDDSNDRIFLSNLYFKIKDYNNYLWEVGTSKKALVTRDISVSFNYPPLGRSPLKKIQQKYPINSWIVRVKKYLDTHGENLLGYSVIPFNDQDVESLFFFPFANRSSVRIDYDASYPTYYTSKYSCPPVPHNKIVKDIYIENSSESFKPHILVYPMYGNLIDASKIIKTSTMVLAEFNSGNDLTGKYYFSFALYDSKNNTVYSDFIASENVLVIKKEQEVFYSGCENYSIPSNYQDQSFKIFNIN